MVTFAVNAKSVLDTCLVVMVKLATTRDVNLPRQLFCPCPKHWHVKQRKGLGINGSTGMLRYAFIEL